MNICSNCKSQVNSTGTLTSDEGVKVTRYVCKNCGNVYFVKREKEEDKLIYNDLDAKNIYNRTLYAKALANLTKGAD